MKYFKSNGQRGSKRLFNLVSGPEIFHLRSNDMSKKYYDGFDKVHLMCTFLKNLYDIQIGAKQTARMPPYGVK